MATHTHTDADRSTTRVGWQPPVEPAQTPTELLAEFAAVAGLSCSLDEQATITDVTHHHLQLRVARTITAHETHEPAVISYPDYRSGVGPDQLPFRERYSKVPRTVRELKTTVEEPELWWVPDGEETAAVKFREDTGKVPRVCGRCDGSTQQRCPRCDPDGNQNCPKCNSGGSSYNAGRVRCRTCSNGRVNCSNCDSGGEVKIEAGEYRTCEVCGGESTLPCSECNGRGDLPCPNGCGDGKITCRRCDGSKEVDCMKCDASGKVVHVTKGSVSYAFTEDASAAASGFDPALLLSPAVTPECVSVDGTVDPIPGEQELLQRDGTPRTDPYTVADVSMLFVAPAVHVEYEYGGTEYELYKVGELFFFDKLPLDDPLKVHLLTAATALCLLLGVTLLFFAPLASDAVEAILG